jgi:hypothetical protein
VRQPALIASALALLAASVLPQTGALPAFAQTAPTPLRGFPQTAIGEVTYSSPAIVDFNGDGALDVLVGDQAGCVWGISAEGQALAGFPWNTIGDCRQSARIIGPLAIADLDGDGKLDVVAGSRGTAKDAGKRGKVWVWRNNGSQLAGWPKEMPWDANGDDLPEVYSVALGDMIGDRTPEVLAGVNNNSLDLSVTTPNLFAWTAGGTLLSGYPTGYRAAGIFGGIATADLTGDGKYELITGRDQLYVHAYNAQGQWLPGWPARTYFDAAKTDFFSDRFIEYTDNVPSVGDLDGDGVPEVVIAGKLRDPLQGNATIASAVVVLRPDGSRPRGWELPKLGGPRVFNDFRPNMGPALGDIDGDGKLEIVVALFDGTIRAYRHDGVELWKYDFAQGTKLFGSEPVLGDVTGDGQVDVVFGTYSPDGSARAREGIYALDRTGKPIAGYPLRFSADGGSKTGLRGAPALADLNGDGTVEIVAATRGGVLYAWNTGAPYRADRTPWPMGRHDIQRTGFTGASADAAGCPTNRSPVGSPVDSPVASPAPPPQIFLPLLQGCS